jgi:hypothetical protein
MTLSVHKNGLAQDDTDGAVVTIDSRNFIAKVFMAFSHATEGTHDTPKATHFSGA